MRITNSPNLQCFHISTILTLNDFLPLYTCTSILLMDISAENHVLF